MTTLRRAALVYAVGLVLHTADHVRRGTHTVSREVLISGAVTTVIGALTLWLILREHRWAPRVATAIGFQAAIGVAAVHLLPTWSVYSDAFPGSTGTGVTALSWTVVLVEIVGAVALGCAGLVAMARARRLPAT